MITTEQHVEIHEILLAEVNKARRALNKAKAAYEKAPHTYGGSVEGETAAVLLALREAQYQAANDAATAHFDRYVMPRV